MNIEVLELIDGAKKATGLTVIIDVFRAFSVAAYAMLGGAERIIPVGRVEEAVALRQSIPRSVLVGERGGKPLPGFDYGNSPFEICGADLRGKTIIQTTGAGTQGVASAVNAEEIIGGSFPMADAIVTYIRQKKPKHVSLVAMGTRGLSHSDEDTLFAEYIKARLTGVSTPDMNEIRSYLRDYPSARKFFDATAVWAPEKDFELCLTEGNCPFVLRLTEISGGGRAFVKIPMG